MKIKLLASILFFNIYVMGQTETVLSNQNGFEISYKAQKLSSGKKDKWLMSVTAVNKTSNPLYYGVATSKLTDGSYSVNPLVGQFSSRVTVRNATGFLSSDGVKIRGEQTYFVTETKDAILFQYEPGRIYNYENEINVKGGDTLIVTVTHFYQLRELNDFNIAISSTFIDGDYNTSCGGTTFSLTLHEQSGSTWMIQTINGKQIKWLKRTATQFTRENDINTTLSYNRIKGKFTYSSSDGINCEWNKQ